jgi:hypothetical protein
MEVSVLRVSGSVRAGAPIGEQVSEVSAVNDAVTVNVRLRESRVDGSPKREQRAEVCAVDLVVDEQVCETRRPYDRDRVVLPRRDAHAWSEVGRRVALSETVFSPASDDSIASDREGVVEPRRDG